MDLDYTCSPNSVRLCKRYGTGSVCEECQFGYNLLNGECKYIDVLNERCLKKVWKDLSDFNETLCYRCIPGYVIGRLDKQVLGSYCWLSPHTACVVGTVQDYDCSKCWGPFLLDRNKTNPELKTCYAKIRYCLEQVQDRCARCKPRYGPTKSGLRCVYLLEGCEIFDEYLDDKCIRCHAGCPSDPDWRYYGLTADGKCMEGCAAVESQQVDQAVYYRRCVSCVSFGDLDKNFLYDEYDSMANLPYYYMINHTVTGSGGTSVLYSRCIRRTYFDRNCLVYEEFEDYCKECNQSVSYLNQTSKFCVRYDATISYLASGGTATSERQNVVPNCLQYDLFSDSCQFCKAYYYLEPVSQVCVLTQLTTCKHINRTSDNCLECFYDETLPELRFGWNFDHSLCLKNNAQMDMNGMYDKHVTSPNHCQQYDDSNPPVCVKCYTQSRFLIKSSYSWKKLPQYILDSEYACVQRPNCQKVHYQCSPSCSDPQNNKYQKCDLISNCPFTYTLYYQQMSQCKVCSYIDEANNYGLVDDSVCLNQTLYGYQQQYCCQKNEPGTKFGIIGCQIYDKNNSLVPNVSKCKLCHPKFVLQKKSDTESDYCFYNYTQASMPGCALLENAPFNREKLVCKRCHIGWILNTGTRTCIQQKSISYDGSGTPYTKCQGQGGSGKDGGASISSSYSRDSKDYKKPDPINQVYQGFLQFDYRLAIFAVLALYWFLA